MEQAEKSTQQDSEQTFSECPCGRSSHKGVRGWDLCPLKMFHSERFWNMVCEAFSMGTDALRRIKYTHKLLMEGLKKSNRRYEEMRNKVAFISQRLEIVEHRIAEMAQKAERPLDPDVAELPESAHHRPEGP